jgi:hypothetical protein
MSCPAKSMVVLALHSRFGGRFLGAFLNLRDGHHTAAMDNTTSLIVTRI